MLDHFATARQAAHDQRTLGTSCRQAPLPDDHKHATVTSPSPPAMDALPPFHIPHRKHRQQMLHQLIRAQMIVNPGQTECEDLRRVAQTAQSLQEDVNVCIQMSYLVEMTLEDPLMFNLPTIREECGDEHEFGCHEPSET